MPDDAGMVALQLFILAPPLFRLHGERFAGRKRDTVNLWTILFFFSKNKKEIFYKYERRSLSYEAGSQAMVLSPVCPTSFNVRPYGTTPTQDNMLSPMAQAILNLEKLRMDKERRDEEDQSIH